MTISGPLGLVLDGASGSGLFDNVGGTLVRVTGEGYPITITGNITLLSGVPAPRNDSVALAGAPLLDDSLLAAFLRATIASREETFGQDPNVQQRDPRGKAGACN